MQNKTNANKNKKSMKPVYKPYLKGNVVSKAAAKRAGKVLGFVFMFIFIYLMLGGALTFENNALRIAANAGLLLAGAMLLYNEGANQGETDVGFGEIAQKRLEEGKNVPASEYDLCFHPMKGVYTAALGALPIFLVCLVFSFVAQKQGYVLGVLPSWVSSYESQPEVAQALAYYSASSPMTLEDVLRVIVRMIIFPFVTMAGVNSNDAMYLVDKLSPILCLTMPAAYAVGYLRGPFLRALVHGNIRMSHRKHKRREQKARKERRMQMEKKELI